jgi:hypothetical protein
MFVENKEIMILNGKAKELFLEWYFGKGNKEPKFKDYSLDLAKAMSNAIIIEWLDSVDLWENNFYYCYRAKKFSNHKQATTEAIKKANELINHEPTL